MKYRVDLQIVAYYIYLPMRARGGGDRCERKLVFRSFIPRVCALQPVQN